MVTHPGSDVPVTVNWKVSLPSVTVSWVVETDNVASDPRRTPKPAIGNSDDGGDVALPGSSGTIGRAEIREAPGHKLLVVRNHDLDGKAAG